MYLYHNVEIVMESLKKLFNEIKIIDSQFTKIRIGNKHDGGYIAYEEICKITENVISIGVEDNVSFDLDFVTKFPQSKVHLFDHTVDKLPHEHDNFTFHKVGVGINKSADFDTLKSFSLGMSNKTLLKMDIEWNEWKIFKTLDEETLNHFSQLLVEFHLIHVDTSDNFLLSQDTLTPYFQDFYSDIYHQINDDLFELYAEVLSKISKYFYIFHIHANNSLPKTVIKNISFPPLLELSFVRKDLIIDAEETKFKYPIKGLDYPNKPYKDDIANIYPLG